VFAHDLSATFRCDLAVPGALWVNDHPRALFAEAQAARFGSKDWQAQLAQLRLERLPGAFTLGRRATLRPRAQEDVAFCRWEADLLEGLREGLGFLFHCGNYGVEWCFVH